MSKLKTKKMIAEVLKRAEAARSEWAEKYLSGKTIENVVVERLEDVLHRSILAFLGLEEDRWSNKGLFRVDHCNGRQSTFRSQIEQILSAKLPDLVEKHAKEICRPLPKQAIAALKKEYEEALRYRMRDAIIARAKVNADKLITQLMAAEEAAAQQIIDNAIGGNELADDGL